MGREGGAAAKGWPATSSLAHRHAKAKLVVTARVVQLSREDEVDAHVHALLQQRANLAVCGWARKLEARGGVPLRSQAAGGRA